MFFRIERTGPPDGGPVRDNPPGSVSTSLTLSRPRAERLCVSSQRSCFWLKPVAEPSRLAERDSSGIICPCEYPPAAVTRPLSLRDTRTTPLPAASPAGALRLLPRSSGALCCSSVSPSHSFSPSGWSGECVRSLGCAGLAKPATDPHSGTWDSESLPARSVAASRPAPAALAASPRSRPIRFRVRAECAFPSPSPPFCSPAISAFQCLPTCRID